MAALLSVPVLCLVACGADVREVTDGSTGGGGANGDGGGGGGGARPVSPCRSLTAKEACCAETCLWLDESEGFPGVCFDAEEHCLVNGCPAGQSCFERSYIPSTPELGAQCRTEYGLGGQPFAACVDACPPVLTTHERCVANE